MRARAALLALCIVAAGRGPQARPAVAAAAAAEPVEDCDADYWGLGKPKDLRRAFECYERAHDWLMLTLLHLNGEGTAPSVARARAAFDRIASDSDGIYRPLTIAKLQELLVAREKAEGGAGTASPKRIDFCYDVAQDTVSRSGCDRVFRKNGARAQKAAVAGARAALPAAGASGLAAVNAAFEAFVEAERARTYQAFIDGSARDEAARAQERFVRDQFARRVTELAASRSPVVAARSFAQADAALNAAYREDVREQVAEYRKLARESQHRWVRYRDAWGRLVHDTRPPEVAAASEEAVRALITDDRVASLANHPLGGG